MYDEWVVWGFRRVLWAAFFYLLWKGLYLAWFG